MFRANRKRKTVHAYVYGAKIVSLALIVIIVFVGWMFIYCKCQAVGQEIKALELQNVELLKKLKYEELKWAKAKSPENLQKALSRHGLIMGLPDVTQFVRVPRKDIFKDSLVSGVGAESREFAGINTRNTANE